MIKPRKVSLPNGSEIIDRGDGTEPYVTQRKDGFWWVKWHGALRPKHRWRALQLKRGEWVDCPGLQPPECDAWLWGHRIPYPDESERAEMEIHTAC